MGGRGGEGGRGGGCGGGEEQGGIDCRGQP